MKLFLTENLNLKLFFRRQFYNWEKTSITIDEFVFDPSTLDGSFLATLNEGSVKVLSGLINQKNPEKLEVKTQQEQ